jgi:hypothetical protein
MSDTWDQFLKQYHAQAREKADGYDPGHFDGLTDEEKNRAFDLLTQEAEKVPETASAWLFYLDPQRAEQVTLDQVARKSGDPHGKNYERQFELLRYTHDLRYQRDMLAEYPHIDDFYKVDALHLIRRTPETPELCTFLRNLLLHETDGSLLAAAAVGFMGVHKLPKGTPAEKTEHKAYSSRLKSSSATVRVDAIQEIEQKYPFAP